MFADIDSESVFNLTEGNLIKIFQLAQLMLEYINHERRVLEHQFDDFVENRELVLQLLERTGVASLGDVRDWTSELGRNFQGLAGRELEDMFGQAGAPTTLPSPDLYVSSPSCPCLLRGHPLPHRPPFPVSVARTPKPLPPPAFYISWC